MLAGAVGGVGDGVRLVAGSLLCLAALKSSRHMCHAAMKQACRPLRRSSSGKWIFFSGVPKVISFWNFSIHSVILSVSVKNIAKLFLVRMPAQSMYSRRGLASGMPFSVKVTRSSACRLVMLDSDLETIGSQKFLITIDFIDSARNINFDLKIDISRSKSRNLNFCDIGANIEISILKYRNLNFEISESQF